MIINEILYKLTAFVKHQIYFSNIAIKSADFLL